MGVTACIPSIGLSSYLRDLINVLQGENVHVHVYVNSNEITVDAGTAQVHHIPGKSIYAGWNHAAIEARRREDFLLLLNDDVRIAPCVLRELTRALETHDMFGLIGCFAGHGRIICDGGNVQEFTPAIRRRDVTNWCVLVRPEIWIPVDERFHVWYGDDDMLGKIAAAGVKLGVHMGLGVWHDTSTTIRQVPGIETKIEADRQLWESLHR